MKLEDFLKVLDEGFFVLEDIDGEGSVQVDMPAPRFLKALYNMEVASIKASNDGTIAVAIKEE